ncbi:YhdP family protein [Haliea sp. E17]|uniref:YhdP family protein n=1 Tax=Haliea sp. E17 TaxID=3401576 RepID=UPI003AAE1D8F
MSERGLALQSSIFHRLSSLLWTLAVAVLVVFAVYVSLGRLLSNSLSAWQDEVLAEINRHLPFHVDAASIQGTWHSFTPEIALHDLEITLPGGGKPLNLIGGRIGVDVLDSLGSRSLQFTSLQLEALDLQVEVTADGRLVVPGFTNSRGEIGDWLREFLLNLETLRLRDNTVQLHFANGEQRQLTLDVLLSRAGSQRHLEASLFSSAGTRLTLSGDGLGDPFRPASFVGSAYAVLDVARLDSMLTAFASPPAAGFAGELHTQAWLDWDSGEAAVDLAVAGSGLALYGRNTDWSVPLDTLAFKAHVQGDGEGLKLFLQDGELAHNGQVAALPRLQLTTGKQAWTLRSGGFDMQPLYAVLAGATFPAPWSEVLTTLAPRGHLQTLQIQGPTGERWARDWRAEGNVSELALDSWHGAPGTRNARAYFTLDADASSVALDSRDFSLIFPTVYPHPLDYHSARARIDIDWDSEEVRLRSGPVTAVGEEGDVRALFSLAIPLHETAAGVEMELIAGLRDSDPRFRDKYLPVVLDEGLRHWLSDALVGGRLNQAGFIWRGSLRRDAEPLRTIQVMASIDETGLRFQPDWPMLQDLEGTLLVDDTRVSVWADQARLYDAAFSHLSAETWTDPAGELQLTVDASLQGAAKDGMATIRESPLSAMTGNAFHQWRADGSLAIDLRLGLNLAHPQQAPLVDLKATLAQTRVNIEPGNLQLENLGGSLLYDSARGFRSQDLGAELWQQPVTISVSQVAAAGEGDGRAADTAAPPSAAAPATTADRGAIDVDFSGRVSAQAVQQWLNLNVLQVLSGETEVTARVALRSGQPPVLYLASTLEGAALDLPAPWSKIEPEAAPLALKLPLEGAQRVLELGLRDSLSLHLGLDQQAYAVGVNQLPPALVADTVTVAGVAPMLDVREWQDFTERYLGPTTAPASGASGGPAALSAGAAPARLALQISDLQVGRLALWGNEFRDVDLRLAAAGDALAVDFATDWLEGNYSSRPGQVATLDIGMIDPGRLPRPAADADPAQPQAQGEDGAQLPDLAATDVTVGRLLWKQRELGQLRFRLQGENGSYRASAIDGEIAGLTFSPQRAASLVFERGSGTRLSALLDFQDFGDTLNTLGYARFLETGRGTLDLALDWRGEPQDFSLATLEGSLGIHSEDGRFLQTPSGSGALKVVEILNLAGVVQRLSLSHVFESGIAFDSMDGQVFFHPGTIELASLNVLGSSSAFAMSGVSDVASRSLDGELVATLPVASNLPWVAALAGGLPVAAGVFVVSKVFEKQVNRLSSGVYRIEGTWNDPELTFDRIFDDELRAADKWEAGITPPDPGAAPSPEDPNQPSP